jgi:hypothetical protein
MRCSTLIFTLFSFLYANSISSQCRIDDVLFDFQIQNSYRNHSPGNIGSLNWNSDYQGGDFIQQPRLKFNSALWIGGFTQDGNLKLAGNIHAGSNNHDYVAGPWTNDLENIEEICPFFNRSWIISGNEIRKMRDDFDNINLDIGKVPRDILEWPALGNPHFEGGEFITRDLAPFFDYDGDGLYNPLEGDYPIVMIENPDFMPLQFMFTVYHDNYVHTESFGDPVNIEIHQMDYLVGCIEEIEANTAVFTRAKLVYHGEENLRDVKIAIWEDTYFGCGSNDYIGCNPDENFTFVYDKNGTEVTSIFPCPFEGKAIYPRVFLNSNLESFITNTPINEIPLQSDGSADRKYNLMNGIWPDGTPLTDSGNGYNPGNTSVTKCIFPGVPTDSTQWSLQSLGLDKFDIHTVATIWDGDLVAGDEITLDFGDFVYTDANTNGLDGFNTLSSAVDNLRNQFQSFKDGSFACDEISSTIPIENHFPISIYPNPVTDVLHIELPTDYNTGRLIIYDNLGVRFLEKEYLNSSSQISIDMSSFPAGLYHLEYVVRNSKERNVYTTKVVRL